jgi:addiction module HigA family antidote
MVPVRPMYKKEKSMSVARKGTPNWRVHPGEILREEFLKPMAMTAYALAKRLRVRPPRINDIVLERRGITADTALRLSRFFGTSEQFWLNLQATYDIGRVKAELARELEQIEPLRAAQAAR